MKKITNLLIIVLCSIWPVILQGQIATFPHSSDFEAGIGNDWKNSLSDDFDWSHKLGATTPSSGTGPQTLPYGGNNTDGYVFIESSSPRVGGDQAWLECIYDFSSATTASFSFYYHMYSINIGKP